MRTDFPKPCGCLPSYETNLTDDQQPLPDTVIMII